MIFPLYLDLIFIGILLLWYVVYIVAEYSAVTQSQPLALELHDKHSVTEQALDRAEVVFEKAVIKGNLLLRFMAVSILTKAIPVFRTLTVGIERVLVNMVDALRGQHDLDNMDRTNGSAFVKDIKSHTVESRKNGGAIHEDGAASRT